jgi:hypothetical protein
MTERDYFYDKVVPRLIEERIAHTARVPRQPRRRSRHAIATGLHHLADRLDN